MLLSNVLSNFIDEFTMLGAEPCDVAFMPVPNMVWTFGGRLVTPATVLVWTPRKRDSLLALRFATLHLSSPMGRAGAVHMHGCPIHVFARCVCVSVCLIDDVCMAILLSHS